MASLKVPHFQPRLVPSKLAVDAAAPPVLPRSREGLEVNAEPSAKDVMLRDSRRSSDSRGDTRRPILLEPAQGRFCDEAFAHLRLGRRMKRPKSAIDASASRLRR
jgi:hypothetical protein